MQKADVLIEALAWIRQFRGKVTVIKLGGSVMEDERAMIHLLLDIVFMETVGMRPVVVHGGGAAISRAMAEAGLEPRFVQGRRYTDDATLDIVERVLAGEINEQLARRIDELGGQAQPLNFRTTNVLFGQRIATGRRRRRADRPGLRGPVTRVDRATIENLCYRGHRAGHPLDVHHRRRPEAQRQRRHRRHGRGPGAAGRETGLPQRRQRRPPRQERPDSLIHSLTADQARELIASGAIDSGMIPKVQACLETLDRGVRKVHIIDGRLRHSLAVGSVYQQGRGHGDHQERIRQRFRTESQGGWNARWPAQPHVHPSAA